MKSKNKKEDCKMATQIASTPVVKGSEAIRIFNEMNKRPSEKAKSGAKKLKDYFEKIKK